MRSVSGSLVSRVALVFSVAAFVATCPYGVPAQPAQPMIDVHVHAMVTDSRWDANTPNPISGKPLVARTSSGHIRATIAEFRRLGFERAVVSGDWPAVLEMKAAAPDLVIASYSFGDSLPFPDTVFLRAEFRAGRLNAIGEVAAQYAGIAPDDARLEPYYSLAEDLDIPFGIHIGPGPRNAAYRGTPAYRMDLTRPLALEDVLVRHPKLRLYVMHAGWPRVDDMIGLMYAHQQVYVDIGIIDWNQPRAEFHRYLKRLVDAGYGKRIMFGSDQMVWVDAIGMAVEAVESADFLTAEQKRDILHDNAARFFRIPKSRRK